jgi:carboxyl-terminal processing protease
MRLRRAKPLALVVLGLVVGVMWQSSRAQKPRDEALDLYGTFVDAVEQVEFNYVREIPRKALLESAVRGMLSELDPYSSYFNDREWKLFQKQIEGSFTGIGIQIDVDRASRRLMVVAPLVGSPAYAAGILAGDVILEVDGQSTEGWNQQKAIDALTGLPGTEVKLSLVHPGKEEPQELTVKRAIIALESVVGDRRKDDDAWDFLLDPERKIGYARITSFNPETVDDLKKALDRLQEDGVKGLILDLRDDPGGLLSAAVEVSDLFLDQGTIVSVRGRNTRERTYVAEREGTYPDIPMVVLVNQFSASASEIVASALQDHKRATVVGHRTWGKGSVQNIIPLDNGDSRLRLTVATYWRPSGKNIHRFKDAKPSDEWGVTPDVEVKLTPDQYVTWASTRQRRDMLSKANRPKDNPDLTDPLRTDPSLAKALEIVRGKLDETK